MRIDLHSRTPDVRRAFMELFDAALARGLTPCARCVH